MKHNNDKINKVVTAIEADESLLDSILEMIETVEDEKDLLKTGDDAEEAVVSAIQNAGIALLEKWIDKKNEEAERSASTDSMIRPHEKKRLLGTLLSEI